MKRFILIMSIHLEPIQSGVQMHVEVPLASNTRFAPSKQSPSLSIATHAFALHLTLSNGCHQSSFPSFKFPRGIRPVWWYFTHRITIGYDSIMSNQNAVSLLDHSEQLLHRVISLFISSCVISKVLTLRFTSNIFFVPLDPHPTPHCSVNAANALYSVNNKHAS